MLREGIDVQLDGTIEGLDDVKGRVARRKARYATDIAAASDYRERIVDLEVHQKMGIDMRRSSEVDAV